MLHVSSLHPDAAPGAGAQETPARGDPAALAALRQRLVAADEADVPRRARRRRRRRVAMAILAAALLAVAGAGTHAAVGHRDVIAAALERTRGHVAAGWRRAVAWFVRTEEAPAAAPAAKAPRAPVQSWKARSRPASPPSAAQPSAAPPAPAPSPAPAPPRDTGALAGLWSADSWRMTVDDVVGAVPGTTRVAGAVSADGLAEGAVSGALAIAGHPWTARFRFDAVGRLREILLSPDEGGGEARRAREQLAEAISADHGAPRGDREGGRARWSTSGGVVELRDEPPEQARVVLLDLKGGEMRSLPEREVTLTLRPPTRAR